MNKKLIIAAILVSGVLLLRGSSEVRGIRNNNPGNIEHGQNWLGMANVQTDERYITFEAPEYGIRAMARILRTYRERHGLVTVNGIIHRWAPPVENPTTDYVKFVAGKVGVEAHETLHFSDDQVADLITAIIRFENGKQPYGRETIIAGINLERTN